MIGVLGHSHRLVLDCGGTFLLLGNGHILCGAGGAIGGFTSFEWSPEINELEATDSAD